MDILKDIECGESVKTRILFASNDSWRPGTIILRELESKGYISVKSLSGSKKAYRITELGLTELAEYQKLKTFLKYIF
jgi:predicted transcriptional regulator